MFNVLRPLIKIVVYMFAAVGLFFVGGFFAIKWGLTNTSGIDVQQENFLKVDDGEFEYFPLAHTPEWIAFRQAIALDKDVLARVEKETGVSSRLVIAPLVPEQMRLFYSNRALFKEIFEPLKILGSQNQFSWGIMGLKDDTAREIERRLKDPSSSSYLGKAYEHLLDFKPSVNSSLAENTKHEDQERFLRIVDEHDHYYSYLYTAIYLKEIMQEWSRAGFDISNRPEILATLFNIGFANSKPNANPRVGGSEIDIDGVTYSFGGLAGLFYNSDELIELFPKKE